MAVTAEEAVAAEVDIAEVDIAEAAAVAEVRLPVAEAVPDADKKRIGGQAVTYFLYV